MQDQASQDNRAWWDERVPIHLKSALYDLPGFISGKSSLAGYETQELGPVAGLELLHLQCHLGLDTLSWARLGARVTGYDFSRPALEAARELAQQLGVDARFVEGEVKGATKVLGQQFDVVYTGKGALIWLADLAGWAEVVASLLRPGGRLYLVEFHPLTDAMPYDQPRFDGDYLQRAEMVYDETGDYAVPEAQTQHNRSHQWQHDLGEVITTVAASGLRVELLRERSETYFQRFPAPHLVEVEPGLWEPPAGAPRIPLVYSLLATKPGGAR